MANKYVKGQGYIGYNVKEEPKDFETDAKLNIALFDHETIKDLVDECKPFAKESEFQIHYHSLQTHIKNDNFEVCITVPLAFYNFDQEVTSGSVSMEMKDVNKISTIAAKLLEKKTAELFKEIPILSQLHALGFDVSYTTSDNGSIHRHPGDFSFSSIDYDKDPDEPGVIYRQSEAKDLYQTDSVIYLPRNDSPKFVCTETRIVNVKPVENDGGIKGKYTEIPTYSFITKEPEVMATKLIDILGKTEEDSLLKKFKTTNSMDFKLKEYPLLMEILKAFVNTKYRPNIDNVIGKRIEQERRVHYGTGLNQAKKVGNTNANHPSNNHPTNKDSKEIDSIFSKLDSTSSRNYMDEAWEEFGDEEWAEYYEAYYGQMDGPSYYAPLDDKPSTNDTTIIVDNDEDIHICIIDGKKMIYNESWASWLPIKTKDMTEEELDQFIAANDV